jgi:hypothetical protein
MQFVMDVGDCSRSIPFTIIDLQQFETLSTKRQSDHQSAKKGSKTSPKVERERNHESGGTQSTRLDESLPELVTRALWFLWKNVSAVPSWSPLVELCSELKEAMQ